MGGGTTPLKPPAGRDKSVRWRSHAPSGCTVVTKGDERFTLTAPPPVRALAIAAVAALVGVGLVALARTYGLGSVVLGVGFVGLGLAVALAVVALVSVARVRTVLELGREAITLTRAGQQRRVPWAEIDSVTLAGPRLLLVHKAGPAGDVPVLNPRRPYDPTFTALLRAIQRRLDVDRGYRAG